MKIIGLIGGIGSGKSMVAEMFRRCGAAVLDADRVGHELLRRGDVLETLRRRWGDAVVTETGEPDRGEIARIVFRDTAEGRAELEFLNTLMHPLIGQEIETLLRRLRQNGEQLVVVDAPLLLEAGWSDQVDQIVFVDAPRELRWRRVSRRGWTEAQFEAREAVQWPVERKREAADVVIDNSENPEKTLDRIKLFCKNERTEDRMK